MHSIQTSIIIAVPADICYETWSDLTRLPEYIDCVKRVERVASSGHIPQSVENAGEAYRWEVAGPLGSRFSWVAAVVLDLPNKVMSWAPVDQTIEDGEIATSGSINFMKVTPDRTMLEVKLTYSAPAPPFGELVADVLQIGDVMVSDALKDFKKAIEARYFASLPVNEPSLGSVETSVVAPVGATGEASLQQEGDITLQGEREAREEVGTVTVRPPASEAELKDRL